MYIVDAKEKRNLVNQRLRDFLPQDIFGQLKLKMRLAKNVNDVRQLASIVDATFR